MTVRESLLALLVDEPKHGYQLRAEHDAAALGGKPLNIGQVYTTLDRLERDGLVAPLTEEDGDDEQTGEGRRKRYTLTDSGRVSVREWFASATAAADRPARDELTTKVVLAVGARGVDELAVIDVERHALLVRLQSLRRTRGDGDLRQRLLTDAAAARVEAEVAWLDRCEAEVRAAGRAANGATSKRASTR